MGEAMNKAVVKGINAEIPGSTRALARAAGVSHVLLLHIIAGRQNATFAVAAKVAAALEEWERSCGKAARAIRKAIAADARRTR